MAEMHRPVEPVEPHEAGESRPGRVLCVATVFEDEATARCAQRLIGRILRLSGRDMPVNECAWGFQELERPGGMAAAARRANAADVLVVAAWRDTAALGKVAEWLQHWLAPRREKAGALVSISLERAEAGRIYVPVEEQLAHIARQIGLDFFATRVPPAAEFPRDRSTAPAHETRLPPHPFLASGDPARADRG